LTVGLLEPGARFTIGRNFSGAFDSEQNEQHFAEESWQSDPFEAGS
jgi:hypothetical protein